MSPAFINQERPTSVLHGSKIRASRPDYGNDADGLSKPGYSHRVSIRKERQKPVMILTITEGVLLLM